MKELSLWWWVWRKPLTKCSRILSRIRLCIWVLHNEYEGYSVDILRMPEEFLLRVRSQTPRSPSLLCWQDLNGPFSCGGLSCKM